MSGILRELDLKWQLIDQLQMLQQEIAQRDEIIKQREEEIAKLKTAPKEKPPDAGV